MRRQQLSAPLRRRLWRWLLTMVANPLLLVVMGTPTMGQASATATSSATFFRALTDPDVSLIQIPPDNFQLVPADWARYNQTAPYVLTRDVTIASAAPPALGQLDFQLLMRKVLLAPNVTLTMDGLVLHNVKKLGGFNLDFFMGDTNSSIVLRDSVRVKYVCPPTRQSLQSAQSFAAPPGAPPNSVVLGPGLCIEQPRTRAQPGAQLQCFEESMQFANFTLQVSNVDPEAGIAQPGYHLSMVNVSRTCLNFISAECLQAAGEDTCAAQLLTVLALPPLDNPWKPGAVAGVAAGAVAGFLFVCGLVGWMLWKHRAALLNSTDNGKHHPAGGEDEERPASRRGGGGIGDDGLHLQLLTPTGTTGSLAASSDSAVQAVKLGVLLGSGSFGRVYKGRWHGMDCAVKIMEPCTADSLPRVLKEAEVMMQLNHVNVVRAFQCSVWNPAQQRKMQAAAAERRRDSTGGNAGSPRQARQQRRQQAGGTRLSAGSGSLHGSSTANSAAASSSSTAPSLPPAAAAAAASSSVVINIVPEIVQRRRSLGGTPLQPAAAATAGTSTSGSSTAAGTLSSSECALSGTVLQHQQQDPRQQQQLLQGPPTASRSSELQPHGMAASPSTSTAGYLLTSTSSNLAAGAAGSRLSAGVLSGDADAGQLSSSSWALPSSSLTAAGSSSAGFGSTGAQQLAAVQVQQPAQARGLPSYLSWLGRKPPPHAAAAAPGAAAQAGPEITPAPESGSGESRHGSPVCPAPRLSTDQAGGNEMQVWLVMELATGGSLKDAVSLGRIRSDSCENMAQLLCRLLDAANGLAYLHSKDIIHGDLKAANVLLQNTMHGTYGQLGKISDFGVSTMLMEGATHRSTTSLGTITHMAPEVLRNGRLTKAADTYAFGVMMWEVFMNQTAFSGCHSGAVVERVVLRGERPPVPDSMPPQYSLLMQRCWDEAPEQRPTFEQIIACVELLLDNLTSSASEDSAGRISEGVEEEHSSSNASATSSSRAAQQQQQQQPGAASKAAAGTTTTAAAPPLTEAAPGTTAAVAAAPAAAARVQQFGGAGSSSGADGAAAAAAAAAAEAGAPPPGKGVAEAVEDWLSGPDTPGLGLPVEKLAGLRQWLATQQQPAAGGGEAAGKDDGQQQQRQAAPQRPLLPWRLAHRSHKWAAHVVGSGSTGSSSGPAPPTPHHSGTLRPRPPSSELGQA